MPEDKDNIEYDPDQETTKGEQSSEEEEGPSKVTFTFPSKNGHLSWSLSSSERKGRAG